MGPMRAQLISKNKGTQETERAVLAAHTGTQPDFRAYNVATGDYITVREIAELALEVLELPASTPINYGDQPRGWAGDVPIVRIATDEIRGLGWQPSTGAREALEKARSIGVPSPFLVHVTEPSELPFGGW